MEIIKTWDEFEEKVLNLHRSLEYENWDRCSDFWKREYKKEMSDLAYAYVKGAEGDRVEAELRCKQINRVNLNNPYHFFCSEEEMARLIWAARAVTKSEIEKEIQAREQFRIKVQKEEEEARQIVSSRKKMKKTQDDIVMELIKKGGIATDRRMPTILFRSQCRCKNALPCYLWKRRS